MATSEESERSGAEDEPGGAVTSGGATSVATYGDADAAGAGGRNRFKKKK